MMKLTPRTVLLLFSGSIIVVVCAIAGLSLQSAYRHTVTEGAGMTRASVRSAELHTSRTVLNIDAALLGLTQQLAAIDEAALAGAETGRLLRQTAEQSLLFRSVSLAGIEGALINSSAPEPDDDARKDAAALAAFHRGNSTRSLHIGAPQHSAITGLWTVTMSRPFALDSGAGLILAAEISTDAFTDFFDALNPSKGTSIQLLLNDGTLIAAEPHDDTQIGKRLDWTMRLVRQHGPVDGTFVGPHPETGQDSIIIYNTVPLRPLLVLASLPTHTLLHEWRATQRTYGALICMLILSVAVFTASLLKAMTRRESAIADTRHAEILLRDAIESMAEGVAVYDSDDRMAMWNQVYVDCFPYLDGFLKPGVTFAEVLEFVGRNAPLQVPDAERQSWTQWRLDMHRNPGRRFSQILSDGRHIESIEHRTRAGGVVIVVRDVTELKRAEADRDRALVQANAANKTKSEFLANMSHELRTPLNAIIGFSEVLGRQFFGTLNQRQLDYARDIEQSGRHLLEIINDILDLSKIEVGRLELFEEQVDIYQVAQLCLSLVRQRASDKGIVIRLEIAENLPKLLADEVRLKQILLNLLSNAVKFTDSGGQVRLAAEMAGDCMILSVTDSGLGMSPADIEIALQPFGQVVNAMTRHHEGTGLGLPLVSRLAALHGATLDIQSEIGAGTRITLRFPPERVKHLAVAI